MNSGHWYFRDGVGEDEIDTQRREAVKTITVMKAMSADGGKDLTG